MTLTDQERQALAQLLTRLPMTPAEIVFVNTIMTKLAEAAGKEAADRKVPAPGEKEEAKTE